MFSLCSINGVKAAISRSAVQCGLFFEVLCILFDSIDQSQPTTLCYPIPMKDLSQTDARMPSPVPEFRSADRNISQDGNIVTSRSKPCRRLLRRGTCKFGRHCHFSHGEGTVLHNIASDIESSRTSTRSECAANSGLDVGVPACLSCDDDAPISPCESAGDTLTSNNCWEIM